MRNHVVDWTKFHILGLHLVCDLLAYLFCFEAYTCFLGLVVLYTNTSARKGERYPGHDLFLQRLCMPLCRLLRLQIPA